MRYDAAIIGAGTNGLAAAAALAGAGLKVMLLERAERIGGRATTREFHPGFWASPFCDDVAEIPAEIFRALDLARHGAIFVPTPSSLALWPHRRSEIPHWAESEGLARLSAQACLAAESIRKHIHKEALCTERRAWLGAAFEPDAWPGEHWSSRSLIDLASESLRSGDEQAHYLASILIGRAADPRATGTALLALAAGRSIAGTPMGGLGTLSKALASAAHAAGVEVSLGLEVTDILHDKRRACGVRLADGTEVEARAVVSTLDLRRSFFSLFAWKDLPSGIVKRVSAWRQSGSTARLLLALDNVPAIDREFLQGPIHIAPDYSALSKAFAAWRTGTMAERLPLVMRIVSALDPGLAPQRKSAATVTIGCIPYRLFDGPWTNEKRVALTESVLASIDAVLPGTARSVLGSELILPPDIEQVLGLTGGDLDGGEIAPDQMFGKRGFPEHSAGRTPIAGLYLGGRASPAGVLGTCAAGIAAARALIADSSAGLIR